MSYRKVYWLAGIFMIGAFFFVNAGAERGTDQSIPNTIVYKGTKYINCRPVREYPFATNQEVLEMSGVAVERVGTRSFPWQGLAIDKKLLFCAYDNSLLFDSDLAGQKLLLKGYPGTGEIIVTDFLTQEPRGRIIPNAFFVTEIIGWTYISGFPINETDGTIGEDPVYFWLQTNNPK
jgi:hypothetical protein